MENLDALSIEELMAFWLQHQRGHNCTVLFPDEKLQNRRRATANLANYAANSATAQRCRKNGDIERALMYEGIADNIYSSLPGYAKW